VTRLDSINSLGKHESAFFGSRSFLGHGLSRRQSCTAISGRALFRRLVAGAISFFLLRASIARHQREPEFKRLNKKMARKNLIAILIYIAALLWHSSTRRSLSS